MKRKILVIDDSPTLRKILDFYLTKNNYLVQTANNGKVGLYILEKETFDLIILDIQMPVMSGKEVLLEMRAKNIKTPILILSAEKNENMVEMGLELGALFYMTKPFKPNDIVAKIHIVFKEISTSS